MTEDRGVILQTGVDTTGARAGFSEINTIAAATASSVEQSARRAGQAVDGIGAGANASATRMEEATRRYAASLQRQIDVQERLAAGVRGSVGYLEVQARQMGVSVDAVRPLITQLEALRTANAQAFAGVGAGASSLNTLGVSAAQTANALRGVPAQFTDIVTSLQGGQRPLSVFLQQGGQLRDMFGSAGGAARALGGYVLGLVNPFTVGAAVVGGLAYAYNEGSKEAEAFSRALILSGNAAGTSTSKLIEMSANISKSVGTQGNAAAALVVMAGTGRVAAENLNSFTEAAIRMERVGGQSIADTAKDLAELSKAPLDATTKLNEQYHYLTASIYEQIKALQDRGHADEAGEAAQKAYSDAMGARAKDMAANLGVAERAWRDFKDAVSGAGDALLKVGRKKSAKEEVADLTAQIDSAKTGMAGNSAQGLGPLGAWLVNNAKANVAAFQVRQELAQATEREENRAIEAQQKALKLSEAQIQFDKEKDKYLTRAAQRQKEIDAATAIADKAGLGQDDKGRAAVIAGINNKYADLNNASLAQLEASRKLEKAVLVGKLADAEDSFKRRLIGETAFIEQKRDLELAEIDAEIVLTKRKAQEAGKKEDKSAQIGLLGDVAVLQENRRRTIVGAQNAIAESSNATTKAIDAQALAWKNATTDERLSLGAEVALFGQSADARAIAIDGIKIEAEARKLLDAQRLAGKVPSTEEIARLQKETDARKAASAATIAQRAALVGAEQLRQENLKFAANSIADEDQRAAALLKIDADLWRERITLAGAGTEAQKQLQQQFDTWYMNRQAAPVLDRWKSVITNLDNDFREGFRNMLAHGAGAWSAFSKSLGNTLKTSLADALYQTFIKKYVVQAVVGLAGAISGPATAAQLVGNVSGAANTVSSLAGIGSAISGIGTLVGSTTIAGFGGGLSAGLAGIGTAGAGTAGAATIAAAGGNAAAGAATGAALGDGIATALAAIPVWGWAALGAAAIAAYLLNDGPEQNTHLKFGSNNAPGNISINERGNEGKSSSYIDGFGTSALGTFGVVSSLWMSSAQPAIQEFIKAVSQTDDILASFLTDTEKAAVKASLTGKTSQAQTGAEGSNPNATGQLDKVFAARINNILAGVEPGLESLIAGFDGTSQALATEAGALLQYRAALRDSGEAVFGAKVTLQEIAALKLPTEATSAALTRITAEFNVTNQVAAALGKTAAEMFGAAGLATQGVREQLALLTGGVDALSQKTGFFAQNFLSDAERLAPVATALGSAMALLGLSGIATRDQFKDVVKGLDLTTEAGAKMFASLLDLAPAFAQVHAAVADTAASVQTLDGALSALKDAQAAYDSAVSAENGTLQTAAAQFQSFVDAVTTAQQALASSRKAITDQYTKAIEAEDAAKKTVASEQDKITAGYLSASDKLVQVQTKIADTFGKLSTTLRSFLGTLDTTDLAGASPKEQFAALQSQFGVAAAQARAGDTNAGGLLPGIAQSLIKDFSGSQLDFSRLVSYVRSTITDVANIADARVKEATPAGATPGADPLIAELQAARLEQIKWADAAKLSGSALTRSTEDLLAGYADAVRKQQEASVTVAYWASVASSTGTDLQDTSNALYKLGDDLLAGFFNAQTGLEKAQADLVAANTIRNDLDLRQASSLEQFVGAIKDVNTTATAAQSAAQALFNAASNRLLDGSVAASTAIGEAKSSMSYWGQVVTTTAQGISASVQALVTAGANAAAAQAANAAAQQAASGAAIAAAQQAAQQASGGASAPASNLPSDASISAYGDAYGGNAYYLIPGINDYAAKLKSATDMQAQAAAMGVNYSLDDVFRKGGHSQAYWQEVQRQFDAGLHPTTTSIRGFATGGWHPGGLRIVGENGPELEATGASRVWNTDQTRQFLQGQTDQASAQLIRELIAEIRRLREDQRIGDAANVGATKEQTRFLRGLTDDGLTLNTTAAVA